MTEMFLFFLIYTKEFSFSQCVPQLNNKIWLFCEWIKNVLLYIIYIIKDSLGNELPELSAVHLFKTI